MYMVSDLGRVFSFHDNGKILSPKINKGYKVITLCVECKKIQTFSVHRLVAKAFIPNPTPKKRPDINHKNGIKHDNRAVNLEWSNDSKNQIHALQTGLKKPLRGQYNPRALLTDAQVVNVREAHRLMPKGSIVILSKKYGVSKRVIYKVVNRKTWAHIK